MQRKNATYKKNKRTRIVRGCLSLLLFTRVSPFSVSTSGIYSMKVPLPNNNTRSYCSSSRRTALMYVRVNSTPAAAAAVYQVYDRQQASIQYKNNAYEEKRFHFKPVRIRRTKSIGKINKKKEHKTWDTPTKLRKLEPKGKQIK